MHFEKKEIMEKAVILRMAASTATAAAALFIFN